MALSWGSKKTDAVGGGGGVSGADRRGADELVNIRVLL